MTPTKTQTGSLNHQHRPLTSLCHEQENVMLLMSRIREEKGVTVADAAAEGEGADAVEVKEVS